MRKKVKVALVGFGSGWEHSHAKALVACADLEVGVVIDPDVERRKRAQTYFPKADLMASWMDWEDPTLEAWIVAVPPAGALAAGTEALQRGVALLLEKPGGLNSREIRSLDRSGSPLAHMMYQHRFDARVLQAAEWLQSGSGGRLCSIRADCCFPRAPVVGWRSQGGESCGVWLDLVPHVVDLVLFLTGKAIIKIEEASGDWSRASFSMVLEDGTPARIFSSRGESSRFGVELAAEKENCRVDLSSKGRITFSGQDRLPRIYQTIRQLRSKVIKKDERGLASLQAFRDFAQGVRGGKSKSATLGSGAVVIEWIEQAMAQTGVRL